MKVHHFAIEVRDLARSADFYANVIGFALTSRIDLNGDRIVFLALGGHRLELVQSASAISPASRMHLALEVEELIPWLDRLPRAGCVLVEGPVRWGNGWRSAFLTGPDGEFLEFIEAEETVADSVPGI